MKTILTLALLTALSFSALPGCVLMIGCETPKCAHKCQKGEKCGKDEKCEGCEKGDKCNACDGDEKDEDAK